MFDFSVQLFDLSRKLNTHRFHHLHIVWSFKWNLICFSILLWIFVKLQYIWGLFLNLIFALVKVNWRPWKAEEKVTEINVYWPQTILSFSSAERSWLLRNTGPSHQRIIPFPTIFRPCLIDHIVKCKKTEYIIDNCCGIVFKKQTEFLFRWVKTGLHEEIVMHYSIFLKHWSPQSRISGLYSTYLRNKLGHPRGIPDYSAYSYCGIRLTKCTLWLNRCHHITVLVFEDFVNAAHTQPPWL